MACDHFVELGFVPAEIPSVKNTPFWWHANGSLPTDNARWGRACPAYGATLGRAIRPPEVRAWYFEVWNEPNLPSFFRNVTQAQYFELYNDLALLWYTKSLLEAQHNRITAL
jgi:xylan 1,4-beta-xylosidase